MPPAAAKKIRPLATFRTNQKKGIYRKSEEGRVAKKNLKVLPLFGCSVITIIIYIPSFWKEDDDEDQGFVGDERAWGRRSLAPNRPGSSSFGLSREHARKREREKKRKRARRFELRKKKEEKRGVTKRRVEVRILASLAHHE